MFHSLSLSLSLSKVRKKSLLPTCPAGRNREIKEEERRGGGRREEGKKGRVRRDAYIPDYFPWYFFPSFWEGKRGGGERREGGKERGRVHKKRK